jgi:DNA-binding NarL/FixJ family response regulator
MAKLILVDDHVLLRNGLAELLKSIGHEILFDANNGKDLIEKLRPDRLPDVLLLDINMPEMDGYETAQWVKAHYPEIKILALSMYDDEGSIIRMLRSGAKGYMLKDSNPKELNLAIDELMSKGYYYSELVGGKLMHMINKIDDEDDVKNLTKLSDRELDFLKYACTELTYREIADKMFVSPRTVDGYRDMLFEKLQLKTRVGLAIYAIKNGIVKI